MLLGHVTKAGSINLSVKNSFDLVNQFKARGRWKGVSSSNCHTADVNWVLLKWLKALMSIQWYWGSVPVQVLWAEERAEKGLTARQSFVDLGCGNGLLVHILTNEGVRYVLPPLEIMGFWMYESLTLMTKMRCESNLWSAVCYFLVKSPQNPVKHRWCDNSLIM